MKKEKEPKKLVKKAIKKIIKPKLKKEYSFKTEHIVTIAILTAVFSFLMGMFVARPRNELTYSDEVKDFISSYLKVKEDYYDEIDDYKTLKIGLEAIINSLDPYTSVIDDSLSNTLETKLEGSYQGLGIEVFNSTDGDIVVNSVLDNSSASEAGIQMGDIIAKMNDESLKNVSTTDFVTMVKEQKDNDIVLTINRSGNEFQVTLKRKGVIIPSIYKDIINRDNRKIGYIYINIFALNTYIQFSEALEALEQEGIDSLIVDVRSNSGGHLRSAEQITSMFLDDTHIIYQIETKESVEKHYSISEERRTYPVVVLIDENSASASEIFAAAMQEEYNATLVGKKSFGKGTVQEVHSLGEEIEYKITTKKWLTPKGNWIHQKGVKPDVEVELDLNSETDTQLEAAINELLK